MVMMVVGRWGLEIGGRFSHQFVNLEKEFIPRLGILQLHGGERLVTGELAECQSLIRTDGRKRVHTREGQYFLAVRLDVSHDCGWLFVLARFFKDCFCPFVDTNCTWSVLSRSHAVEDRREPY